MVNLWKMITNAEGAQGGNYNHKLVGQQSGEKGAVPDGLLKRFKNIIGKGGNRD